MNDFPEKDWKPFIDDCFKRCKQAAANKPFEATEKFSVLVENPFPLLRSESDKHDKFHEFCDGLLGGVKSV